MYPSTKQPKKSSPPMFVCKVCNIRCTSAYQLEDHFRGIRHKIKAEQVNNADLRSCKGSSTEYDEGSSNREKLQSYNLSRYRGSSRSDKKKDKSSSNHSPRKIEEDDSILIASCDSSDEDPTCVLGTETIDNPKESAGDQSELCPSEKSDSELQVVEDTSVSLQSKEHLFAFLRNFEVSDKADVAFIKEVKYMFSDALRKYQGKDIDDKQCFGAGPVTDRISVERTSRRFRTYSGSRSVSISTKPLHTSDKYTAAKQRKRNIHSSSRSSSSDRVQSTSRSSLRITIKSDSVEAKSDGKGLPGDMVNEMENKELLERSTNQPSLADTEDHEMDKFVDRATTECLTAEAASSDDEDL